MVHPIQIVSLVLGIISISLGVPVAIQNLRERWATRVFLKASLEKSRAQSCNCAKNLEGHVLSEEERVQIAVGRYVMGK